MVNKNLSLVEMQERVLHFEQTHNLETKPEVRILDLLSELGEVAKEILKSSNYGKEKLNLNHENWMMEMGDIFFCIITLANATDVDLEEALEIAITKLAVRIETKGNPGSV